MTEYSTMLTNDEIDYFIDSISKSQVLLLPTNTAIFAKRRGRFVILKGLFFKTSARITNTNGETTVEMKTTYRLALYPIAILLLAFFCLFLFADKVTITGNSDPTFFERLGFVLVGVILFLIPFGIIVQLKSDFVKKIEKELKLNKNYIKKRKL